MRQALLRDEPRQATVTATSGVVCLTLSRARFAAVLGPMSELLKRHAARRTWEAEHARERRFKLGELRKTGMLGVGAFGRVQLVVHEPSGAPFAMKCLSKGQIVRYQQAPPARSTPLLRAARARLSRRAPVLLVSGGRRRRRRWSRR